MKNTPDSAPQTGSENRVDRYVETGPRDFSRESAETLLLPIPKPGDGPTGGQLAPGVVAGHRRGLPAPGGLHLH